MTLAWWLECFPMAWETCVQSQVESYQRLKNGTWWRLANTQPYKVPMKDKREQPRERRLCMSKSDRSLCVLFFRSGTVLCIINVHNYNYYYYYYYYFTLFESFSLTRELMVSDLSLSDSRSSPVSRTRLNFLADLYNAVVWIVSTCAVIFKSSSPFTKSLGNFPDALTTIGLNITFSFHSF